MNKSTPIAESIEFINVKGISPLISKCDIKVLYLNQNRNKSDIRKNVAEEMAQTLPGCPIVGQYVQEKGDFLDHGTQMVIDGQGARVNNLTKPYGFVPLGAKVWFQDFDDVDKLGKVTRRTYLVTEGYLWTGQFEECKRAVEEGNPQSMELDNKTLKGYWSTDYNLGVEFFIINDAIISKLCILGDDVEPCFEGASVTAPEISSTFSKSDGDDGFSATLFAMMKQLRELKNNKGGYSMDGVMDKSLESTQIENQDSIEDVKTTFDDGGDAGLAGEGSADAGETTETPAEGGSEESSESDVETTPAEGSTEEAPSTEETEVPPITGGDQEDASAELEEEIEQACINVPKKTEFVKKEDEEEEKSEDNTDSEDKDEKSESDDNEDDKEEEKKKYSLLEEQFNELQDKYSLLENEVVELRKFKEAADNQKKDELIESFYMLSDEDKKEVVENKTKYSLDEIEAKLSVICVRKKVNFNLVEEEETSNNDDDVVTTYNLNAPEADMLPAWLKAVKDVQSRNDD